MPSHRSTGAAVWTLTKQFLPYVREVWRAIVLACLLVVVSPLVNVALLWLMKVFIDEVFMARNFTSLPTFAIAYVGLVTTALLLSYLLTRLEAFITEAISQRIRSDLYHHVISVSPGSLRSYSVGGLLSRLSGDPERVEFLIYSGPLAVAANILGAIYYSAFLFLLSWQLTLLALLLAPLLVLLNRRISPRVRRVSIISRRKTDAWMSLAEERLSSAPAVQAFDATNHEASRFADLCRAAQRATLRGVSVQAWLTLLIELVGGIGGFFVLALGTYEMYTDRLTVGSLVAFLGSVGSLYSPIRSLARSAGRFQRAAVAAERVGDLLKIPSLITEQEGAEDIRNVRGGLEFCSVRFAYPDGTEVLRDISFRVEPGETLALVGPNGSGKSTLVQLALRLYDPSSGCVLLDGKDVRKITLSSLRQAIGVVFQDGFLFRGSIRDNIQYGSFDAGPDATLGAARAAHIDGFVGTLRRGYHACVGPRGTFLSGGQRQRVALARAILRNAPVLLLDEATASIDSESEALIQDALENFGGRRTILLVSHRLSSIQRADRVVVLEEGRVVEVGTPADLQKRNGRFRSLFASQILAQPVFAK